MVLLRPLLYGEYVRGEAGLTALLYELLEPPSSNKALEKPGARLPSTGGMRQWMGGSQPK